MIWPVQDSETENSLDLNFPPLCRHSEKPSWRRWRPWRSGPGPTAPRITTGPPQRPPPPTSPCRPSSTDESRFADDEEKRNQLIFFPELCANSRDLVWMESPFITHAKQNYQFANTANQPKVYTRFVNSFIIIPDEFNLIEINK